MPDYSKSGVRREDPLTSGDPRVSLRQKLRSKGVALSADTQSSGSGGSPQPTGGTTAATAILDGYNVSELATDIPLIVATDTMPLDPIAVTVPGVPVFEDMYATKIAVAIHSDAAIAGPWVLRLWTRVPNGIMTEVATFPVGSG